MSKVYIVRGLQASGKTTLAKQIVDEIPNTIRINRDDIRAMFHTPWSKELEEIVKETEYSTLYKALKNDYNVVIDDVSNYNPKTIERIENVVNNLNEVYQKNIEIIYKDLFTPLEECIKRDSFRSKPVGRQVIKNTFRQYCSKITAIFNKQELSKKTQEKDKPHAIIVDIDGTLCYNVTGRPFFGYDCAQLIKDDVPFEDIINIVNRYNGKVIIVSGRNVDNNVGLETSKWLDKYITVPYELYLREDDDFSPGEDFKKNIYETKIKPYYYIDFALEDSPKIVRMYRDLGITVLQPTNSMF